MLLVSGASALSEEGPNLPELFFLSVRNEFGHNVERSSGIDQGTVNAVGALTVLVDTVGVHAVHAL